MSQITLSLNMSPEHLRDLETIDALQNVLIEDAAFKTGSISLTAMVYLRQLCEVYQPLTVVEVGTFIGKSTYTILNEPSVQHVYTCDKDNDCLRDTARLTCHPSMTSTEMLGKLVQAGVYADMFFFDGRLSPVDVALILRLSKWNTLYVFDDYHENPPGEQFQYGKGVFNVSLIEPFLKAYRLIEPPVGDSECFTTIAVLLPKELL